MPRMRSTASLSKSKSSAKEKRIWASVVIPKALPGNAHHDGFVQDQVRDFLAALAGIVNLREGVKGAFNFWARHVFDFIEGFYHEVAAFLIGLPHYLDTILGTVECGYCRVLGKRGGGSGGLGIEFACGPDKRGWTSKPAQAPSGHRIGL